MVADLVIGATVSGVVLLMIAHQLRNFYRAMAEVDARVEAGRRSRIAGGRGLGYRDFRP